jgi:hypothetical protein
VLPDNMMLLPSNLTLLPNSFTVLQGFELRVWGFIATQKDFYYW